MSDLSFPDPPQQVQMFEPQSNDLPCPECGQLCKDSTGLGVHRSVKHGYRGDKKNRKIAAAAGPVPRPKPKLVKHAPLAVEEILDGVTDLLWPDGKMPVAALNILISWREDTERMLRQLEAL